MNNIEDKICQAIDIIVQRAISQADYDKTIQATILKCIDQTIGKYTVRYQDSTFYAYSNSSDTSYSEGTLVYVLVPSGDMSKDKTILGAITKLGTDFVTDDLEINKYDIIGDNCIEDKGETFGLKSYFPRNIVEFLYNREEPTENKITINEQALLEYIKESDSIICSATFKTALPAEQQFNGNYGLLIALDFKDNSTGQEVTREYVIDVNSMQGNPYRFINDTKQSSAFSIDSANFLRVNYVSIFCYDFPHNKIEDECIEDIWIKDIELKAAKRITEEELNGYSISFITPRGVCFNENHLENDTITIQAQVKVKNKIVDVNSQAIDFYWFVENINVTSQSPSYYQYYNQYGGQGWKCLNQKNIINQENEEERATIQWVPEKNIWTIAKKDVAAKETLYKCVAVYSGISISKEIKIKRLDSKWNIIIESSGGTNFYFDNGKVNLICNINNEKFWVEDDKLIVSDIETEWLIDNSTIEIKSDYLTNYISNGVLTLTNNEINLDDYTFCWAKINQNDYFETLSNTNDLNTKYSEKLKEYNDLNQNIKDETVLVSESKEELESLKRDIAEFNKITRVDENIIYNVSGNSLDKFCIFKCSVYKGDTFLGTGSITLTNKLTAEGVWNLVIHNGEKIFKYNEYGLSPADKNNIRPIAIEALSFSLYDNLGNKIDEDAIRAENIKWTIPTVDTMLETDLEEMYYTDNEDGSRTYSNTRTFPYKIANSYDIKKQKNNIRLDVTYKNISLSATTNLVFVKQGDSGTNGSDYICRIVPNCNNIISEIPVAAMNKATNQVEWNFVSDNKKVPFKAQLWHNENIIFNSSFSGKSSEGKDVKIKWSILRNKYDSSTEDASYFAVEENYGEFSYNGFEENSPANIIKVELQHNDVTYYATLPIITTSVNSGYKIKLKENTGFNYVVYSSDGKQPIYDNSTPFEIIVTKEINGFVEDISLKETTDYKLDYNWEVLGSIVEKRSDNRIKVENLFIDSYSEKELNKNQKSFKAVDSYDGQCINNAIQCTVKHSGAVVAKIHIPIHFMLNRYGNSAINGWDGNSVNIDSEGGFILAPQAGAGQKEDDNSFTGVLIGKVKEGLNSAEVGLFGYHKGQRSIFLDAKTGTAKFGLNGAGQIIIDPSTNEALLYSGNYVDNEKTGSGMLIDLTTPKIKYGNGNFYVDQKGRLIAKGDDSIIGDCRIKDGKLMVPAADITGQLTAGQIAAGSVTADKIAANAITAEKISANAVTAEKIIADAITSDKIKAGAITADEISANAVTSDKIVSNAITAEKIKAEAITAEKITTSDIIGDKGRINLRKGTFDYGDGKLKFDGTNLTVKGTITATSGTIGKWNINDTSLYKGSSNFAASGPNNMYLGDNGISISNSFKVSNTGVLTATGATINGTITATSGTIGKWNISDTSLYKGSNTFGQKGNDNMYLGDRGLSINDTFKVSNTGVLTATGANITGAITATSLSLGTGVTVAAGKVSGLSSVATSGKYSDLSGRPTIPSLTGYIKTDGTIGHEPAQGAIGFKVSSQGLLTASNAIIYGKIYASEGTVGGCTISNNALSGGTISGATITSTNTSYGTVTIANGHLEALSGYDKAGYSASTIYIQNSYNNITHSITITPNYIQMYSNSDLLFQANSNGISTSKSLTLPKGNSMYSTDGTVKAEGLKFNSGALIFSNQAQNLCFFASGEYESGLFFGVRENRWTLCPDGNYNLYIGTPNNKWNTIYAKNGTIQNSDAKQKNSITSISSKYEEIFNQLKPVSYKFNNGKRIHTGFISQDIEKSIYNVGLTEKDWAAFCKDKNEDGSFTYGLRYDEIIALNTHMIQKLMNHINELEKKLNNNL